MSVLFIADRRAAGLWARVAVIAGAGLASGLGAPTWATVPLTLAAAAITVHAAMGGSGRTWVEYLAYACGGTLAALVLVGLGLDVVPGGLNRVSWAVALGVVAAVVVVWSDRTHPSSATRSRLNASSVRTLTLQNAGRASWYVGALVVVVVAIGISVHSARVAQRAPAALSVVSESAGRDAVIQVSAGYASGSFELVSAGGARTFTLDGGETRKFTVAAPAGERTTVTLRRIQPDGSALHVVLYGTSLAATRTATVTR
ncbi:MAG: hypothetical protein INR72_18715 [Williamsia herbipolensis]|nr:hypothetical protein [Williamsia herbipolensis]